jgi:hypothetical protein
VAAVADSAVNYDFAGLWSKAGDNLFCQDGNMTAGRRFAFCMQMCLYLGVGRDVVLLVLLQVAFRVGTAVSASPRAFERRLSTITRLVNRVHTNSGQSGCIFSLSGEIVLFSGLIKVALSGTFIMLIRLFWLSITFWF